MTKLSKSIFISVMSFLIITSLFVGLGEALEGKAGEVIKTVGDLIELRGKGLLSDVQVATYTELVEAGIGIPIIETSDRSIVSDGYKSATEKYKGTTKLGPDGTLENYVAGRPFPDLKSDDPQVALKAAWNREYRHEGDDLHTNFVYWLVDDKGNMKTLAGWWYKLKFCYRTDLEPKPNLIPENPGDVRYKEMVSFTKPFSSKSLTQLSVFYTDPFRDYDVWVYVPGLRRVTRLGGANKCDSLGGFVYKMDDSYNYRGPTLNNTYKLLEVKDHLVEAFMKGFPENNYRHTKGLHTLNLSLERRKIWLMEATPKDPNYCYGKRIWYLDPESWWIDRNENYDRQGNIWVEHVQLYGKHPNGYTHITLAGFTVDHKILEAGPWNMTLEKINIRTKPAMFSLDYMRRIGR